MLFARFSFLDISLLGVNERPDLVTLYVFAGQSIKDFILIFGASFPELYGKVHYRIDRTIGDSSGRSYASAFYKA